MQPSRARARDKTGLRTIHKTATFGDLPEPLRQAIFHLAWRDTARWWPAESRTALRLVCREARDAIDATRDKIGDVNSGDKAAALARAVAAGRLTLRELCVGGAALTFRDVAKLFEISWDKLEKLSVGEALRPRKVEALASAAARLPELRELRLRGCGVGDAGLEALLQVAWPRLMTLEVQGDSIGVLGTAALASAAQLRLPVLRELSLTDIGIGDEALAALAQAHWPCLEVLGCSHNNVCGVGATTLAAACAAGRLPQLRELDIGGNELGDNLRTLLSTEWPELEVLEVYYIGIGTAGIAALAAASARLPKLRELDLHGNTLHGEAVTALAQGSWPHLRTLKLGGSGFDESGASALGSSRPEVMRTLVELDLCLGCLDKFDMAWRWRGLCLARLEVLSLAKSQMYSFEAATLAQANEDGVLPALRVLNLSLNAIGTLGVLALSFTTWLRLEELGLSWAGLDDTDTERVGALAEAAAGQRFPALKSLALSDNGLDGVDFERLAAVAWPCLQTLDLAGNSITPAMASRGLGNFPALQTLNLGVGDPRLDECEAKQLLEAWPGLRLLDGATCLSLS